MIAVFYNTKQKHRINEEPYIIGDNFKDILNKILSDENLLKSLKENDTIQFYENYNDLKWDIVNMYSDIRVISESITDYIAQNGVTTEVTCLATITLKKLIDIASQKITTFNFIEATTQEGLKEGLK